MEEEKVTQEEIPETEEKSAYTPRPKWQIWGAWIALGVFVAGLILYYSNIFRGGV